MTSPRREAANRKNALASTGPRTASGKARAARNGLKHGILSTVAAVPGLEKKAQWERHRSAVMESLAPEGYLEELLSDRIALLTWRLQRVARYEVGVLTNRADPTEISARAGLADENIEDLKCQIESLGSAGDLLSRLADEEEHHALSADQAANALGEVCDTAGADFFEVELPCLPFEWADRPLEDCEGWTIGLLRKCIAAVAAATGVDAGELLAATTASVERRWFELIEKVSRVERQMVRLKREMVLPGNEALERIQRYEAHLERSLYRALHELQRLQERRLGGIVPPPAVLDVSLSPG